MKKQQRLSLLAAGTWHLGVDRYPEKTEISALHQAIDSGITTIDTAEMYGLGRSERLVGKVMVTRREEVCLVSKIFPWNANLLLASRQCQASLKRLNTDYLDYYLLHWRYPGHLPWAVRSLEALRQEGLIGGWGVSNFDIQDMTQLLNIPGGENCQINQVLYNCQSRGIEYRLMSVCQQAGIRLMAYSPLGGAGAPLRSAPVLERIAMEHGTDASVIALAWILRQENMTAITETGNPEHAQRNALAGGIILSPADIAAINGVFPPPTSKQPLDRR